MPLTQKETNFLNDLKKQEQLCVEKYERYASSANDKRLAALFREIGTHERQHLATINEMLSGSVPSTAGWDASPPKDNFQSDPMYTSMDNGQQKQEDAYMCSDTLSMEKKVSGDYDTAVFEFCDNGSREVLNHIQTEEQNHGKRIYDYMSANGMYN